MLRLLAYCIKAKGIPCDAQYCCQIVKVTKAVE